jgi:hypothetical protein
LDSDRPVAIQKNVPHSSADSNGQRTGITNTKNSFGRAVAAPMLLKQSKRATDLGAITNETRRLL